MLSDLWYRLRALFTGRTMDRELDEELRFHLEHETEQLRRAGVPPAEAARRARLSLGGATRSRLFDGSKGNMLEPRVQRVSTRMNLRWGSGHD